MLKNEMHGIYLTQNNNEVTINKFNASYQYIILEQINNLPQNGYVVFNHLYVNPGFEEDFERVFLNRDINLTNTQGFESLLFLKPCSTNEHYVIITIWKNEESYKQWQDSQEYKNTHQKRGTKKGADQAIVNRKLSFNISLELKE
ncbi:antibiotic biosynthesis monooxygenase family protein [Mammaliicoccus sciuri]|uniref:antibiotic biosynthesis monooxygenase family protein n=1 Tax=Mammaliicoccus sciuri TaxID=1296 RepID=UPI002888DC22|nr:antibiotic biosynthesis monooxygenase [Mammaliicoccus sciuri]MDT0755536.1 antibiotic biosynthesis monooxygenase [Mammaliicoccus sciuri]